MKLDGEPVAGSSTFPPSALDGALLQVGKRRFKRLVRG